MHLKIGLGLLALGFLFFGGGRLFAQGTATAAPPQIMTDSGAQPGAKSGPATAPEAPFRDCEKCPEMVPLPAGNYFMGASAEDRRLADKYSIASELPQHRVNIAYSFAIARFELTVAEFAAFVQETGTVIGGECEIRTPDFGPAAKHLVGTLKPGAQKIPGLAVIIDASFKTPGAQVSDKYPATCISRREARAYLAWLSKKTGRKYRFPTEAEWEYAVRAGNPSPFYFGGSQKELCQYGNFADKRSAYQARVMARCAENPSPEGLAPVGSYRPNAWGLYDMIGNAFEFIEDCVSHDYRGAPADGSPYWPSGSEASCSNFITRGYFFESPGVNLRSAARCVASDWTSRSNGLGIRVAVSLSENAWDRRPH